MMNTIPVFSPQDASLFLKYFSGVAQVLARRFSLGFHPDEEHLTSLLCELLDEQGSTLHNLEYSIEKLNNDLNMCGSLLRAAISLETTPYTKYQERHFTQADFGIILEYTDHVDPKNSFRKGMLVQAKKIFPTSNNLYSLSSRYNSFDTIQHERLSKLEKYYHHREFGSPIHYLLYNPPFSTLPKNEQEYILHRQLSKESKHIYDYTNGLCLYSELTQPDGLKSVLELSSLFAGLSTIHSIAKKAAVSGRTKEKFSPFELKLLTDEIDIRQQSFAWFLVFGFLGGETGSLVPDFLELVSGSRPNVASELRVREPRFVLRTKIVAGSNPEKLNIDSQPNA